MRKWLFVPLLILVLGLSLVSAQETSQDPAPQQGPEPVSNLLIVHVNMNVPLKAGTPMGYPLELVENIKHGNPVTKLTVSKTPEGQYYVTVRFAFRGIDAFHEWFQEESTRQLFQQFQQEAKDVQMDIVGSFNPYDVARR